MMVQSDQPSIVDGVRGIGIGRVDALEGAVCGMTHAGASSPPMEAPDDGVGEAVGLEARVLRGQRGRRHCCSVFMSARWY